MDDEPRTNNDPWAVVPPMTVNSEKRKALRIALIVAALGAVAAAAVRYGGGIIREKIRSDFRSKSTGVWGYPVREAGAIETRINPDVSAAEEQGQRIDGGEY